MRKVVLLLVALTVGVAFAQWTPPDSGWTPPDSGWTPPDSGGGHHGDSSDSSAECTSSRGGSSSRDDNPKYWRNSNVVPYRIG